MRKGKRSKPGGQAWFFALALPGVALFMLFSLMPYDRMVGQWPLGIRQDEVMAYQALFDHRPGQHAEGRTEVVKLVGQAGAQVLVQAGETRASGLVQVNNGDGITLHFPDSLPFRGAFSVDLIPADLSSLAALYAGAVADSLPIMSAPVRLVNLLRDGENEAPCLMVERITPAYVLVHAPVAMTLVDAQGKLAGTGRSMNAGDSIGDAGGKALLHPLRFDSVATAALGLLACAEERKDLLRGGAGALRDGITGALAPLYATRGGPGLEPTSAVVAAFHDAMAARTNQAAVLRLAAALRADSAAWAARFLAIDSAAVPVLAKGRNIGLVQAEVDRTRAGFMQRLFHPDVQAALGPPVDLPTEPAIPLDPWLLPFRTNQDTLRFVRGKYDIDHDLVIPRGMALVLEKGTRWFMAPGVSVVVNGELHMRGTGLNPVFIRPQDPARPSGSIAVNGSGATRVRIAGLRISGGGNLWWEGVQHGGMLSFIGADVRMAHCTLEEGFGDASVAVRRSTFQMADCHLSQAHHAFVDLAEVHGAIERTAFLQPAGGLGATDRQGVALRSSHVLLRGCSFTGLPFTALSVARAGEALVLGSTFSGNAQAIQAVEGSNVQVDGCDFTGNGTVFVLRRNRPVLGGATLKLYTNTCTGNGTERDADAASTVEAGAALPPDALRVFTARKP
ncbi:MAG: right-handed parallel beta-helix repeat-containing protein [Flavobacteriales bacterium]|nr:right-handed parallel beta-helix repeat-containing protein [Flavobacteriales bacterium]MBP9080909.1 right-handed parallel beta-helix repeat-containing protein [Flavobacteriales bacterium]